MGAVKLSYKQGVALNILDKNDNVEELFFGGSAGPGKTFLGCYWQIKRRVNNPDTRGLIGRNTLKDLKDTTLETFFKVAREIFEFEKDVHFRYYDQKGRIVFANGSMIYLRELKRQPSDPDFHDLGSLEITDAFIDEASEITKKAKDILKSRIRYNLINGAPKILLCSNPSNNWIKEEYVIDKLGNEVELKPYQRFLPALVDDNPDKEFVEQYKKNLEQLPTYDKQRLLYGDWTATNNDTPFFYEFFEENKMEMKESIKPCKNHMVLITFDFNVGNASANIMQQIKFTSDLEDGIHMIDTLTGFRDTKELCSEIKLRGYHNHAGGVHITGDSSGSKRDTRSHEVDYTIIFKELELHKVNSSNIEGTNARLDYSRKLCNVVLRDVPTYWNTSRCGLLLADIEKAKATKDGKLFKNREQGHEQDIGDAWRYGIHYYFYDGIDQGKDSVVNYLKIIG